MGLGLQQGPTGSTSRKSRVLAVDDSLWDRLKLIPGGEGGIRTHGTLRYA